MTETRGGNHSVFARWRVYAFIGACIAGMALVIAIPGPHREPSRINPRTGEPILTPAELVRETRATGDARVALQQLIQAVADQPGETGFARAIELLRDELSAPTTPAEDDPRFLQLSEEDLDLQRLTAVLTDLLGDVEIARATEAFFVLSSPKRGVRPKQSNGLDARAVTLQARSLARGSEAGDFVGVVRDFQNDGRPRGWMRWLLRGYRAHPESPEIRNQLIAAYIERGRLIESFAVSTHALKYSPTDHGFWKQRARLSAWLSRAAAEAGALEHLVREGDNLEDRERLLALYAHLGRPERAVPHAVFVAEVAGRDAEFERAIELALTSGVPDRALDLLSRVAKTHPDEPRWRELIVDYALQDLRVDLAVAELESLVSDFPSAGYHRQLEELYRRLDMPDKLATALEQRLSREPANADLWAQALSIRSGLGDDDKVEALLTQLAVADIDLRDFFQHIYQTRRAGIPRFEALGVAMAQSAVMRPTAVSEALDNLRPFVDDPAFRDIAMTLLRRFPDDPAAKRFWLVLIDMLATPEARAHAAEDLASEYPHDIEITQAWADRAEWADMFDSAIRARLSLARLGSDDLDNRARLAELYEALSRYEDAAGEWETVAASRGPRSPAARRLVGALMASGQIEPALSWLEKRASHPDATLTEKVEAADDLFAAGHADLAAVYYRAALALDPEHARSLLRLGQIHSWSNDPGTAIDYLRRRLAASDQDRALVEYFLGEALWAVEENRSATRHHESAISDFGERVDLTTPEQSMVARMLFRLRETDEAKRIYRELVAADPKNVDLALDYVEVLVHDRDLREAHRLVSYVGTLDANHKRLLRTRGQILALGGRFDDAKRTFHRSLDLYGPDAGVYADLGFALERDGDWQDALDVYRRWFALQSESHQAARAIDTTSDRLADLGLGAVRFLAVGDDRTLETGVASSLRLDGERTRLNIGAGYGYYSGRAQAVAGGSQDVVEDVGLLDIAVCHRTGGAWQIGGGISAAPGAPGNPPIGGWIGAQVQGSEPFSSLEIRLLANELLTEPAASVGLAGRQSGLEAFGFHELGSRFWTSGQLRLYALQVDAPGGPTERDGFFGAEATVGYGIIRGDTAIADRFRIRRCPAGPLSPWLVEDDDSANSTLLNAWVTFQSRQLLGDRQLANLIPIGDRFNYLIAAARGDRRLTSGLGASVEAYVGHDFSGSGSVWGADAGMTWRPSRTVELTVTGGLGKALGRPDDSDTYRVQGQLVLRW